MLGKHSINYTTHQTRMLTSRVAWSEALRDQKICQPEARRDCCNFPKKGLRCWEQDRWLSEARLRACCHTRWGPVRPLYLGEPGLISAAMAFGLCECSAVAHRTCLLLRPTSERLQETIEENKNRMASYAKQIGGYRQI